MGKGMVILGVVAGVAGVGVVGAGGTALWARSAANAALNTPYETHIVDFPIPFPLSEEEVAELREEKRAELPEDAPEDADPLAGVDLDALALERAIERGEHYVSARYACAFCHGADFGGGVMVDDPAMGTWRGPNISSGGQTANYAASDWDRAVRHGVLSSGVGSIMPITDFVLMSDEELSDIAAYITSRPPVEGIVPRPTLGPISTMLIATGKLVPDVAQQGDHHGAHLAAAPEASVSPEFGKHLAQICVGCHRADHRGGPITIGPPDWPAASNLTPHEEGLAGWSFEEFEALLRTGVRPDGTVLLPPMIEVTAVAASMTDTELEALWVFLQSLPPTPTGE